MNQQIRKLIDQAQIVSFDIFDTLILRKVPFSEDIFNVVEKEYVYQYGNLDFNYKETRLRAEDIARENRIDSEEITLDEIYRALKVNIDLNNDTAEKLKEIEIELEINLTTQNNYLYRVYDYCIRKNKRIIFCSDMYLPEETIVKILKNNGYSQYERLFLSSTLGKTKASGSLYSFMAQELGIKPQNILHIGDNLNADIESAKERGFKTYYYEKCVNRALKCPKFKEMKHAHLLNGVREIEQSFYISLIINKFYNDPNEVSGNFWYELGYRTLGMMFFGFSSWIFNRVKADKLEKVFFLSRDGYILKKIYDIFSQYHRENVSSEYFYASRRLFSISSINPSKSNSDEFLRLQKFLTSGTSVKVSQFLESVGLDPDRLIQQIKAAGFSGKDANVNVGQGYSMLCDLYLSIFDELRKVAVDERKALLKYLEFLGIINLSRFGVVDIGWNGTMQNCLSGILESIGKKPEIFGYYLGTTALIKDAQNDRSNLQGYLVHQEEPAERYKTINDFIPLLELFHFAPHGSTIRILEKNGKPTPVFDEDCHPEKVRKTTEMHTGVLDFVKDYLEINRSVRSIDIRPEEAFSLAKRLFHNPTYDEAVNIGDIWVVDGHIRAKKFIAKPPMILKTLVFPDCYGREYNSSLWKEGFKRRKSRGFLSSIFNRDTMPKADKRFFKDKSVKRKIRSFIEENKGKRICFYGAGRFAEDFVSDFDLSELDIAGFIDKNSEKNGQKIGDYTIYSPENIDKIKPDLLVITLLEPRYAVSYIHTLQLQMEHKFEVVYDLFY